MKTIICIGCHDFLLPASANVNAILKSLGGAIEMESKFHNDELIFFPSKRPSRIEVKLVKDTQVISGKHKLITERASPDANGENIFHP